MFTGAWLLLLAPLTPAGAAPAQRTGREVPVTATDLRVTEANNSPTAAVDPTNDRFVAIAHRLDAPFFGCGLQVSGDGGRGWVGAQPVPVLPEGAERCYAPEIAFDRHGTLYYLFIGLAGLGNAPVGAFLTTSSNRGRSFGPPWRILGPENYMVRMAIDRDVAKDSRIYLAWLHASAAPPLGGLPTVPNPILSAHSDDGGRTFSEPVQVSDPERQRAVAPALVVGPDHVLHVAYYDLEDDSRDYQGLVGPVWDGTWSVVLSSSRDRGATFDKGVVVADRILPTGRVMLIFTMPAPAVAAGPSGEVYAAWPDARSGDADVLLSASGDGGRSWGRPVRVNDDPPGKGTRHELPRLAVAPGGRVDAVFFDRRNDPENLRNDVYYTSSTDAGRRFAPNLRLTTDPSDSRIGQGYQVPSAAGLKDLGSRLALLSGADAVVAAWPDTRNSSIGTNQQDVFAARIRVDASGPGNSGSPVAVAGIVVLLAAGLVAVAVVLFLRRSNRPSVA